MADIRIKDLATTATTTASDDFMAVDGSTNGTRKMNAAAPAFLTSVTTPSLISPAATALTLGTTSYGTALTVASATGDVSISSTTAASANAGALVIAGGISAGNSSVASYFGGAVTVAGTLRATNGNLYTYGESGDTTTGLLFFNSAANNYIYGSGSQLAVYTAGGLRATIASTGSTFAGAVAIGNSVAGSIAAPSTHKVSILIGGVQYYLLASNV